MSTKFIFVSGGVLSGLGKGITTSSLAAVLESKGYRVSPMKVDMYLNVDAGTIRPIEHGEVFVTTDGVETDQDLGNYERFIGRSLSRVNYLTTGQVYLEVLRKERAFEYGGEDVEAIPHITDEIIRRFELAGKDADIVIVELGGTVGEYQNGIFFEATRILKLRRPSDVIQIHVAYLPVPGHLGEMKTKPVQQSVRMLNSMGIQPDFVVGRSEKPMDDRRKERLALFCNVSKEEVISNPDVVSIYELPVFLDQQNFGDLVLKKLGLEIRPSRLAPWRKLSRTIAKEKPEVKIAVVGKYFSSGSFRLADVYISVIEAIKHAAWSYNRQPVLSWVDSETIEKDGADKVLKGFDGIVVPGGFGSRGIEGIISAIQFARQKKVPYLGLCYGMQLASVEFARHVCSLSEANSTEINPNTTQPVIHVMPDQEKKLLNQEYGGSMRLGSWACHIAPKTISRKAYGQELIMERHRHRYEFNNEYRDLMVRKGLVIGGTSPDGHLVEIIELKDHPFFVGVQFHPEFQSSPLKPHPLFKEFMKAAVGKKK